MNPNDPYADIAPFYALEQAELADDLTFFAALAAEAPGPVLDLGCGAGRVAAALAARGLPVTAIDASPAMLALARAALQGQPGAPIHLVQADLRSFRTTTSHVLAVCAAGTFAHLLTSADQLRALRAVRAALAPGGRLALVLQNPYHLVIDPPAGEWVLQWSGVEAQTSATVLKLVANEADLAQQHLFVTLAYDVTAPNGTTRRHLSQFTLRWTYQPELDLLLRRAGLTPEEWYGDYDRSPYGGTSPLLIAVARRP